jgi:hypothetical protein
MDAKSASRKYKVSDVYREATRMLKEEMQGLTKKPLSQTEEVKMKELGKLISKMVLKEMKIV